MTSSQLTTVAARWVCPSGAAPPFEDAWIEIVDGRITAVEPRRGRAAEFDFGDAVILPGLVNAHTHLDLTGALGQTPPVLPFPDWLREVITFRRCRSTAEVANDTAVGIRQSIAAGTTLVGDIASGGATWGAIADSPLKCVVFHELLGLTAERADAALAMAKEWLDTVSSESLKNPSPTPPFQGGEKGKNKIRAGLSPHAPYSFRFDRLADVSRMGLPVAIHFAESLDELDLIAEHDGEFVPFLDELGVWDPTGLPVLEGGAHPLAEAKQLLLIHGNYLPADAPIPKNATMIYCPRTHWAFGHPPHPFREWMNHGARVALGTDSLASNPDLSILNEARFVFAAHPDLEPQLLLNMITTAGAEALGFEKDRGAIAPGFAADLCVVGLSNYVSDPLQTVFAGNDAIRAVFADGQRVV